MSLFDGIFLGIVQGLTEFLPVSSSGHLVLASDILMIRSNLAFITTLHFATLLAVITYFFRDILLLIQKFFIGSLNIITRRRSINEVYCEPYFRISFLLIIGTIPTGIIAIMFKDWFESLFSSVFAVGCFLVLTGALLLMSENISKPRKTEKETSVLDSLVIGVFQGMAVAPGLSRSGATVSASLLRGLNRPLAARFSFLLSIPAVFGATLLELKDIAGLSLKGIGIFTIILGVVSAFISGYFAIKVFMDMIQRKKISVFSYYCFAVGTAVIIRSLLR